MKAIQIDAPGGPEVLKLADVPDPVPAADQSSRSRRSDRRELHRDLPAHRALSDVVSDDSRQRGRWYDHGHRWRNTIGHEDWRSRCVAGFSRRVRGMAKVPLNRLVNIPDEVTTDQAAAVMLQGMTAHYLANTTFSLKPGDVCLIQAAAGGVGLLFCQMASRLGARDRHRIDRRQGGACKESRCRHGDQLHDPRFRDRGEAADPGARRGRRVRFGWQVNVAEKSRLPRATRDARPVRQFERPCSSNGSIASRAKGLAVSHSADARTLCRDSRCIIIDISNYQYL